MSGNARQWGAIQLMNLTAQSASTQGAAVDLATYANLAKREMKAVFVLSTALGTSTLSITECDTTNGTFTVPTGGSGTAATLGTATGIYEVNFLAQKRYIRAEVVVGTLTTQSIAAVGFAMKREANS